MVGAYELARAIHILGIEVEIHDNTANDIKGQVSSKVDKGKWLSVMCKPVKAIKEYEGLFENTGQKCQQVLRCKPWVETFAKSLPVFAL